MVGGERPGRRAAVERLEHRRLDLDEPRVVEEPPHRGDDPRAGDEQLAGLVAGDQVELAVAEAGLDVGQAVVLLRRRPQRLGQQRPAGDPQASARRGASRTPVPSTPIRSPRSRSSSARHPLGPELVDPGLELDPARSGRRGRGTPSCPGRGARPGGPRPGGRRRSPRPAASPSWARPHRGDRLDAVELLRERLDRRPPAALRASAGGRRRRRRAPRPSSPTYFDSTSILVIFSLRSPRGVANVTSRRACGRAAPCRPATRWRASAPRAPPRPSRRSCT